MPRTLAGLCGLMCFGKGIWTMFSENLVDPLLARGIGRTAQRQRDWPQAQLEQPVAARGLQIIMALGGRPADELDLGVVETETRIGLAALRFDGAIIGKQDALRAAFDDRGRDAAPRYVGEALGCEDHRDVLLA